MSAIVTAMTTTAPVVAPDSTTAAGPVRDGVAAVVPLALGYVPFGLVVGTALADRGGGVTGWAGSWLVYGGSAQLAALRSIDSGVAVALITGLVVNARMVVYTASLGRRWRHQPRWFKLLAASLVIDLTWALAVARPPQSARAERRFFLAVGLVLGVVWLTAIGVGATLGARSHLAALDVVAPIGLVALLAPRLTRRGDRTAILVAALVAWLAGPHLPAGTGIVAAVLAAVATGELVARPDRAERS